MKKNSARILLACFFVGNVLFAQFNVGAPEREQYAARLSAAASKNKKGPNRLYSAQGQAKENLFVIDKTSNDPQARSAFLQTFNVPELAKEGFRSVVLFDGVTDYWISRVCPDHLAPSELLMHAGVEARQETVPYGFVLGIGCEALVVEKVVPGSSAASAGLRDGDILRSINGQLARTRTEAGSLLVAAQKQGEAVSVGIVRNGSQQTVALKVSDATQFKPVSKWPDAFSRRNFQLGITLSQFRTLPFPDEDYRSKAYLVCSDEERAKLFHFHHIAIPDDLKAAGVTLCSFYTTDSALNTPENLGIMLGDQYATTIFSFMPEEQGQEPRLFEVESTGPADSYEILRRQFIAGFGAPTRTWQEAYQTKAGSVFQNDIALWENQSSSIRFSHFSNTTEKFIVELQLKPLVSILNAKLGKQDIEKAKKL